MIKGDLHLGYIDSDGVTPRQLVVRNVHHSPETHTPLLAANPLLASFDYRLTKNGDLITVGQPGNSIDLALRGHHWIKSFRVLLPDPKPVAATLSWDEAHQKWGHLPKTRLEYITDLTGTTPTGEMTRCSICSSCNLRDAPHSGTSKTTRSLEMVHCDLTGPYDGEKRLVMALTDSFTRMSWCYFLPDKKT